MRPLLLIAALRALAAADAAPPVAGELTAEAACMPQLPPRMPSDAEIDAARARLAAASDDGRPDAALALANLYLGAMRARPKKKTARCLKPCD